MSSVMDLIRSQEDLAASIREEMPEYFNDGVEYDYVKTMEKLKDICKQEPTKIFPNSIYEKLIAIRVLGERVMERVNF